jgi:hypothetical protein
LLLPVAVTAFAVVLSAVLRAPARWLPERRQSMLV